MMNKSASKLARIAAVVVISVGVMMMNVSTANARTIAYIANADSREIYVLELSEQDGGTRVIEKVPVTGSVMPLAVSPDRKYLYASLRSEPFSVSSFRINPQSGKLTLIKTTPLADNMAYISVDRTGRYLFGASYAGNKISVNAINPNGDVNPTPLGVIPTGENAHCILTDRSNKFLFASNLGDDRLLQYLFDETGGKVTPNKPPATETKKGAGPRHFVFHPKRPLVFGINELDGTLSTYRLADTGTLTLLATNSVMPPGSEDKPRAADIHLTSDGRFLYASERTTSTLAAFRVDGETGTLKLIGNYPTETQPRGFNIDPQGKYLLAVGQKSGGMSTYEINSKTGELRRLSRAEVGENPNWVEIITLPETTGTRSDASRV